MTSKINAADLDPNDVYCKKLALIDTARRCFETGLQTNAGGNLSVRLTCADAIVIKPSLVGFNECTMDNLMIADFEGQTVAGHGKPSADLDFHAALYAAREDIKAIVHVHSPWATGWASAGLEIPCLTVQTLGKIGRMPHIPLTDNGGPQGAREIVPVMQDKSVKVAVLANHGTIGVGKTLMEAQHLVEIIEETAQVAFVRDGLMMARGMTDATMPSEGLKPIAKEYAKPS